MNTQEVNELLKDLVERRTHTITLEPQEVYNKGITGYDKDTNRLIYSYDDLIEALAQSYMEEGEDEDIAYIDAMDWLDYNTLGTCMDGWPIFKFDENPFNKEEQSA